MANEIKITTSLSAIKGSLKITKSIANLNINMEGNHAQNQTMNLTESWQEIPVSNEILTLGIGLFVNLDSFNTIDLACGSTTLDLQVLGELRPGYPALIPLSPYQKYWARSISDEYGTLVILEFTITEH